MTNRLRIACAQLNPIVGDLSGNAALARSAMEDARRQDTDLVVFPELFIAGYPPEDLILKPAFVQACIDEVSDLARTTANGGTALVVGTPWRENGKVYNAAALLAGGKVEALRYKVDLPNYSVFDEKRVFAPGAMPRPINFNGVRLGIPICEDIWTDAVTECFGGAEIPIVPNGSPFTLNLNGEYEIIIDYKGSRRPPFDDNPRGDWLLGEWQVQTYAWLRSQQADARTVAAGILVYVSELAPGSKEVSSLRSEMRTGRTDVTPAIGTPDYYQINAWEPGRRVEFSEEFRLRRALRVIPVTDQSMLAATAAIDCVVRAIEDRVASGGLGQITSTDRRDRDYSCLRGSFERLSSDGEPVEELIDVADAGIRRCLAWAHFDRDPVHGVDRRERVLVRDVIACKKGKPAFEGFFLKKIAYCRAFCRRVQAHFDDHLPARQHYIREPGGEVFHKRQAKRFQFRAETVMQGDGPALFLQEQTWVMTDERRENFFDGGRRAFFDSGCRDRGLAVAAFEAVNPSYRQLQRRKKLIDGLDLPAGHNGDRS